VETALACQTSHQYISINGYRYQSRRNIPLTRRGWITKNHTAEIISFLTQKSGKSIDKRWEAVLE